MDKYAQCTNVLNDQTQGTYIKVTLTMRIIDLQSDRPTWRLDGLDFVVCFCSYLSI